MNWKKILNCDPSDIYIDSFSFAVYTAQYTKASKTSTFKSSKKGFVTVYKRKFRKYAINSGKFY